MEHEYRFRLTSEGNGEILPEGGDPLWNLTTRYGRYRRLYFPDNPLSVFFPPDCTITRTDGTETLTVTQQRRFPLPRFVIIRDGTPICILKQRSFLLNKYALEFSCGEAWLFHMPLFTVFFQGVSATGKIIQVREWTKQMWYARNETGDIDAEVLCALAVIHRERWRVS